MDFITLALVCAPMVSPSTLQTIVKTESNFKPYVIGVNGGFRLAQQPRSQIEAISTATWLIQNGYNVDLGYGQLNHRELPALGMTVADAFDECKNLRGAGTLLLQKYKVAKRKYPNEQDALRAAISAYNTGNHVGGFRNGYVQKVINNHSLLQSVAYR